MDTSFSPVIIIIIVIIANINIAPDSVHHCSFHLFCKMGVASVVFYNVWNNVAVLKKKMGNEKPQTTFSNKLEK